jgi:hypothetical protein
MITRTGSKLGFEQRLGNKIRPIKSNRNNNISDMPCGQGQIYQLCPTLELPLGSKTYKQLTLPARTNCQVIQGHSSLTG